MAEKSWAMSSEGANMQADKLLEQENPGCIIKFFKMGDDKNPSGDFLEINGSNFKKTDNLTHIPLAYLKISDSGMKSLDFLRGNTLKQYLSTLILMNNKLLHDYTELKQPHVKTLILSEHNFFDVSFVGESVKNLELLNTSVSEMNFLCPEQFESLVLFGNTKIYDYSPINRMCNLRRLEIDNLHNTDLKELKNLDFLTFNGIPQTGLPYLPNKTFKLIVILGCRNLSNIGNLCGIKTQKMDLVLLNDQLKKFVPILNTMKIGELNISDDIKNLSIVQCLNSAEIIKFNNKVIKRAANKGDCSKKAE